VVIDELGHGSHRHLRRHREDQGFEQQREPAPRARPRHRDRMDTALRTRDARRSGHELGAKLKEVQVPPATLGGVVCFTAPRPALGARERPAAVKVELNLEALGRGVEIDPGDIPRVGQAKGRGEEGVGFHPSRYPAHRRGDTTIRDYESHPLRIARSLFHLPDVAD
jgi:hypothetical protein